MADQYYGFGRIRQELFQPLYRFDVQVVGGLVEQQQIRFLQQQLGQFYAHAPASRELTSWPVQVAAKESQAEQCPLHFSLTIFCPHHQIAFVLLGESLHQCHIVIAVIVGTLCHLLVHRVYPFFQPCHTGKCLTRLFPYRRIVCQQHHLRQITDSGVYWYIHGSATRPLLSAQYLKQRRLSGTILTDQCHTVTVVDDKTGICEQRLRAERYI